MTSPPFALAASTWSFFIGASEQPKSSSFSVICLMPSDDPDFE